MFIRSAPLTGVHQVGDVARRVPLHVLVDRGCRPLRLREIELLQLGTVEALDPLGEPRPQPEVLRGVHPVGHLHRHVAPLVPLLWGGGGGAVSDGGGEADSNTKR